LTDFQTMQYTVEVDSKIPVHAKII
jgi:hypothetical protein